MIAANVILMIVTLTAASVVLKITLIKQKLARALPISVMFDNIGYLGLSVIASLYDSSFFGQAPAEFATSILMVATPLAITPFALAEEYGFEKTFLARSIVVSTVVSIVTISLWAS